MSGGSDVSPQVFADVVRLIDGDVLGLASEIHQRGGGVPREIRLAAYGCLKSRCPDAQGVLFQLYVHCRGVATLHALKHFHVLMVLQHLDCADVAGVDIPGGHSIIPSKHIEAFYIKFVYPLPIE